MAGNGLTGNVMPAFFVQTGFSQFATRHELSQNRQMVKIADGAFNVRK
jgi:hypothetical protein